MAAAAVLTPALPRALPWSVATVAVAGVLLPTPALAHGSADFGDFYAGLVQPVFHPESLLLLLALSLWVAQTPDRVRMDGLLAFAGAALAGGLAGLLGVSVPGAPAVVVGGALCVGVLVALRWHPPFAAMVCVGALLGAAQGHFGAYGDREEVARPLIYALGLSLSPVLVASWFIALLDRVRAVWLQVGVRVVGSWIATISLLTGVLSLTRAA